MPFMKVISKAKGVKSNIGDVLLIEEEEVRDGISVDVDGNEYPSEILAPLTPEEEAQCLKVEEIPI